MKEWKRKRQRKESTSEQNEITYKHLSAEAIEKRLENKETEEKDYQ
jgi:hypothetical protein